MEANNSIEKRSEKCALHASPAKKLRLELPMNSNKNSNNNMKNRRKFIFGNYYRYYGYRCQHYAEDIRLNAFNNYEHLFRGKYVLDIGCNDGSITIALAKRFQIEFITGLDIDANLISKARSNVTHEIRTILNNNDKTVQLKMSFPNNIAFKHCNYVLNNDNLLNVEEQRYDTIVCLSVTKWIHLNFGDDGLKRAFKRMFRQLKPDGHLILEAQNWKSYKRRKNLNAQINANYTNIQLQPKDFNRYLLSEIGFESCFNIDLPIEHSSNGFKRPIVVYKKSSKINEM